MAHDDQRPAVGVEGLRQVFDARDVEVVGRLVEDQQLTRRFGEQQSRERRPESFSSGERGHGPVDGRASDEQPSETVSDVARFNARGHRLDVRHRARRIVEAVEPLRKVAERRREQSPRRTSAVGFGTRD